MPPLFQGRQVSAIDAALERGTVAGKKKARWKPVDVEFRGWLVARVEDTNNGNIEGIYFHCGQWLFYGVGRLADGKYVVHNVRDAELRRVAKAMIGQDEFRGELINEAWEHTTTKQGGASLPRRVLRKSKR